MKGITIPGGMTRAFHKVGFTVKKHSPEILVVTGIAGVITSAVMACKATTKATAILENTKAELELIHDGVENGEIQGQEYTPEDGKKDTSIVYAQTGLKLVKTYAPAVAIGLVSIGCILASNNILKKRNVALAAAYTVVDKGFKDYRGRVIERFGKELDRELKYNIKTKEVEETVVNEDGTESTVKKTVEVVNPNDFSMFARCYTDGCKGWDKDAEYNLAFLKSTQSYANEKLRTEGYLYLNDVYSMLGFPKTREGSVVGWVYDPKNPDLDNFVDFGFYDDLKNPRCRNFVNGDELSVWLDFNVDGYVYELMH
jgi:hypothetical protein